MANAKYTDAKVLEDKIIEYFETQCMDEVRVDSKGKAIKDKNGNPVIKYNPPTVSGLALYLGFADRQSIYDYKNLEDARSCTIKKAITQIESYAEKQLFVGQTGGAAFWLKNHGWRDKQEIDMNANIHVDKLENFFKE